MSKFCLFVRSREEARKVGLSSSNVFFLWEYSHTHNLESIHVKGKNKMQILPSKRYFW